MQFQPVFDLRCTHHGEHATDQWFCWFKVSLHFILADHLGSNARRPYILPAYTLYTDYQWQWLFWGALPCLHLCLVPTVLSPQQRREPESTLTITHDTSNSHNWRCWPPASLIKNDTICGKAEGVYWWILSLESSKAKNPRGRRPKGFFGLGASWGTIFTRIPLRRFENILRFFAILPAQVWIHME